MRRVDKHIGRALKAAPLPFHPKTQWIRRWNDRKDRLPSASNISPQAFVVEAWSPAGATIPLTLSFISATDERMFQRSFTAGETYSRLSVAYADIAGAIDLSAPYLVQIEPVGDAEGLEICFGLMDFVATDIVAPAPIALPADNRIPKAKVIVWDLDNTLWDGTLVETGVDGLTLRNDVVEAIRELDRRGILHAVASKNDEAEALAALAHFGLQDLFLAPQIGWGPKSDSISAIAAALDLGIDSFIFVDDQPFERGEVQAAHPAIAVLTHEDAPTLPGHPRCDVPITAESGRRRDMYRAEAQRREAQAFQPTDYLGFLIESGIHLTITALDETNVERVYELSQRTNQLNFRGTRFTRQQVQHMIHDPHRLGMVLSCDDRFGDYGIIGFAVLEPGSGTLLDFFMSCRVQRKHVEHAAFAYMLDELRRHGQTQMKALMRRTDRNRASCSLLENLGFVSHPGSNGEEIWHRDTAQPIPQADVVRVTASIVSAEEPASA
ncbi:HAD-IIIC family phosphatase [Altererythrobacter xixiisoli]|uniref:HAD-IIIC family phosphatase n=1 Tax=Croceibacterium xixiisoli TaxID=1476466 RepID=A0A6I4TYC8_9SPHN|nr:HAD-IIIC family phosphatase [Croceibacterium xixiisoli]